MHSQMTVNRDAKTIQKRMDHLSNKLEFHTWIKSDLSDYTIYKESSHHKQEGLVVKG